MARRVMSAAVLAALVSATSFRPARRVLCDGFLPKNNLRIPVGDVQAKGIQQDMFNKVLDRVQEVYAPIIAAHGGNLVINRYWDDATVNASAEQQGGDWIINMYGGLARHKDVTADGFALVACHELGHHLGGYPKIGGGGWASNEGEADYHSTLKCLRRVLPGVVPADLDPTAKVGCESHFAAGPNRSHCEQDSSAGISIARLLADLGGDPAPTIATPDTSVVDQTNDDHPAAQCRLDTMYQGTLCTKSVDEELSNDQPGPGACATADGYADGVRPLCWFKPPQSLNAPAVAAAPVMPATRALEDRLEALQGAFSSAGL